LLLARPSGHRQLKQRILGALDSHHTILCDINATLVNMAVSMSLQFDSLGKHLMRGKRQFF